MSVYFIRAGENGPIRIGFSTQIFMRKKSLVPWSPYPLTLLAEIPDGTMAIEAMLHRRFHQYRFNRDWFSPAPEILSLIDEVKRGGTVVANEYELVYPVTAIYRRSTLRRVMNRMNIAPSELATAMGVKRQTVHSWCSTWLPPAWFPHFRAIAKDRGVDVRPGDVWEQIRPTLTPSTESKVA